MSQYRGCLNLTKHSVEFCFGSVYLCESKISVLVTMEKKVAIDYRRCMCCYVKDYRNFISISQISLRFTTEQLEVF